MFATVCRCVLFVFLLFDAFCLVVLSAVAFARLVLFVACCVLFLV